MTNPSRKNRSKQINPFDFDVSGLPELPTMPGLFFTGTDTGVGKTLVAGAVARHLRHRGLRVEVLKPAASGCRMQRGGLVSDDADFLAACAESRRPLAQIAPVRFAAPLAPNVAAAQLGQKVDLEAIFQAWREMQGAADVAIVEGVGGLLCPISDDVWVIHLARLLRLPVVIVARAGLGTINHTLLTIHAARSAGLHIAGVVVNGYPTEAAQADASVASNPVQIAERGGVKVLALVPQDAGSSVEKASVGEDTQFVVDQVDWAGLAGCRSRA